VAQRRNWPSVFPGVSPAEFSAWVLELLVENLLKPEVF
jgi:hypothetical protein